MNHGKLYKSGYYDNITQFVQQLDMKLSHMLTLDLIHESYDQMENYDHDDYNYWKRNCQHFALDMFKNVQKQLHGRLCYDHQYTYFKSIPLDQDWRISEKHIVQTPERQKADFLKMQGIGKQNFLKSMSGKK